MTWEEEYRRSVEAEKNAEKAKRGKIGVADVMLLLITLTLSYLSVYALTTAI